MKVHNVRFGFATNSSSSHSIIMMRPGASTTSRAHGGPNQFGWEHFRLTNADEKVKYVVAQFVSNLRKSNVNVFEVQKLVADIFGVWLTESDIGDPRWPDIYVDHQSVLPFPINDEEFWRQFKGFVLRDDVVILGGNDNDDIPDGFVPGDSDYIPWFDKLRDRDPDELRIKRDGDVWVFFNKSNGTKSRVSFSGNNNQYVKASTPELVDLKITNFCNMNCKWCYQSSTKQGAHAPKEKIFKIIKQLKKLEVFEIAIGGGEPTLHPDFVEILKFASNNNIVPNFTTYNLSWLKKKEIVEAVGEYVGGVGISVHNVKDIERFISARKTIWEAVQEYSTPTVVAQHVLGTLPPADTAFLIDYAVENHIPLLILGYKDVGFGKKFNPDDFSDFPTLLKLTLSNKKRWCQISVDTAIIEQYPDLLTVLDVSKLLATSEEGKFSCYIDAVKDEMGPSSYAPGQMSALPGTYRGIKKLFVTY